MKTNEDRARLGGAMSEQDDRARAEMENGDQRFNSHKPPSRVSAYLSIPQNNYDLARRVLSDLEANRYQEIQECDVEDLAAEFAAIRAEQDAEIERLRAERNEYLNKWQQAKRERDDAARKEPR